jgi:Methyltransferase domain
MRLSTSTTTRRDGLKSNEQTIGRHRQISVFERILFGDGRQWATSQAEGDVLEIAVGTGRNFQHYARGAKVTGIEFSAEMLAIGRKRAEGADIDIDLRQGDAQALRGRQSRSRTARLPGRSRLRDRECGPPEVGDRRTGRRSQAGAPLIPSRRGASRRQAAIASAWESRSARTRVKPATTSGSNWEPAQLCSSASAASRFMGSR